MRRQLRHIRIELQEHLPYTIFSVAAGMVALGVLTYISILLKAKEISQATQGLFHIFHPIHLLLSATATTAMFWRYERRLVKATIIGFVGAVGICGISDIIIPYVAGFLLGVRMHFHVCIIEHLMMILPFVVAGIFAGFVIPPTTEKSTIFSHAAHVLVSSMASILYLVSFGLSEWIEVAGMVFVYMVLAVMIPCCMSDIIFPLLLTNAK